MSDNIRHVRVKNLEVGTPSVGRRVAVTNLNDYSLIRNGVLKIKGQEQREPWFSFHWHKVVVTEKRLLLKI